MNVFGPVVVWSVAVHGIEMSRGNQQGKSIGQTQKKRMNAQSRPKDWESNERVEYRP